MSSLGSGIRGGGRQRRFVNEINVVPYIDVMLVLLVIFMVTAPLVPPGMIDLPRAGQSASRSDKYVDVQMAADGTIRLRTGNTGDPTEHRIAMAELESGVRQMLAEHGEATAVVISADETLRYQNVMDVLSRLQKLGVRVALAVRPQN